MINLTALQSPVAQTRQVRAAKNADRAHAKRCAPDERANAQINPKAPEFGRYGACYVRYGNAVKGSPPRRRTVLTVWDWVAEAQITRRFAAYRDELGLEEAPHPHLRHSYITHLIEDGAVPHFVQRQVGHTWGSTTCSTPTLGRTS
ncbi:tyrosine-type recombinase/integrase [Actinomadura sp. NPDC023710]|uniref:tyrosine-type recombinase/integrase n=1 Tax=Actinomadura sp. NPDC023710 TaxID=3158219 RepID=UPI0033F06885